MNSAAPDPDDYVTQKTRRIMAQAALRKIGRLVAEWEEEDRLKDRWARRFTIFIASLTIAIFVVFPILSAAFSSHPKVQLFTISILLGMMVGAGLVWWPTLLRRTGSTAEHPAVANDGQPSPGSRT